MRGDKFIFDNVVHMYDNRSTNVIGEEGQHLADGIGAVAKRFSPEGFQYRPNFETDAVEFEEAYNILFKESDTDMVMAQCVPVFGWYKEGFSPVERNHGLAARYPDRVMFCGGVDPVWQGIGGAKESMIHQIRDLGAKSFKFYQTQKDMVYWAADDRKIAYPLYETCLKEGVDVIQFHKGLPFGPQPLNPLRCIDLEQAALDFPEMKFVIHHLGDPYIDETINIATRHENMYIALSAWFNFYPMMPLECLHRLGKFMFWVGADRMFYGSEGFVWPTLQAYIELFDNLEMPEQLQEDYGYPALTEEVKAKIFGLNFAKLMGVDVEAKKKEFAMQKAAE